MSNIPSTCHRVAWGAVAGAAAILALSPPVGAATTTTPTALSASTAGPGAFGSVAAIAGTSMEVQNVQTGQTTVAWTPSTTFTQVASVSLSVVHAGDCVTATGTLPKKAKKHKKATNVLTARTVAISAARSNGTCAAPGGLGNRAASGPFAHGGRPGAFGGSRGSSGSSRGRTFSGNGTGGAARRPFASLGFASGTVVAVRPDALTVHGVSFAGFGKSAGSSKRAKGSPKGQASKVPKPKKTVFSIGITSTTTYAETETASPSDLAVGDCVTARGSSASNGTVTASAVRIAASGGGTCGRGFPGPGGSRGGTARGG